MEENENLENELQEKELVRTYEQEKVSDENISEDKSVNYDVYNGLNLLNEDLGQSYLMEGFNPLGAEFKLDEDFILDVLENNVDHYEIVTPDFIEAGNKQTAKAFELAAENALKVIELLNEHINDPKTPEIVKQQMRKQILYILCRNQLIKVYLKRIKDEKDTLTMYQKMSAINWQLSKTLEDSYKKQFDAKRAAEELARKAREQAEEKSKHLDNLKKEAQKILDTNRGLHMGPHLGPHRGPHREHMGEPPREMSRAGVQQERPAPASNEPRVSVRPGESYVDRFSNLEREKNKMENTKAGESFVDRANNRTATDSAKHPQKNRDFGGMSR